MTILDLAPTLKREITSGTKEWADQNVNCIKGCFNNCRYCYARIMAKRFGRCKDDNWQNMVINQSSLDMRYPKYEGRVMFPSTHDIIDESEFQRACFIVIAKLLNAGNEVLITTKPRINVIKEIKKQFFSFRDQLQFRFTITSVENSFLAYWEPNAPRFEERLISLKYAYANGFKTSVSIEPFLDETPQNLVFQLEPFITESVWIGPMNYVAKNGLSLEDAKWYENIRKVSRYANLLKIYNDLRGITIIRFKDSMKNRLGLSDI